MKLHTFFILAGLFLIYSFSQHLDDLKQRKEDNLNAIKVANELLATTKNQKLKTLNDLLILNEQIQIRSEIIKSISNEINVLTIQLSLINIKIASLSNELIILQNEYAKMIQSIYKNINSDFLIIFLLSSKDFNLAYKRYKYYHHYISYRKIQKNLVLNSKMDLINFTSNLDSTIHLKEKLLFQITNEQNSLSCETISHNSLLKNLKKKEKQLKKDIELKIKINDNLEMEIERIVKQENLLNKQNSSALNNSYNKLLSDDFSKNKGDLPFPLEKGIITSQFGEHPHPILKYVIIRNNGIDIATSPNAVVNSIFKGEVKSIINIPGSHKAIILRHGNFLSVYSNLSNVIVKIGEKIEINQPLGYVYTEDNQSNSTLHFELWNENTKLNPVQWIKIK